MAKRQNAETEADKKTTEAMAMRAKRPAIVVEGHNLPTFYVNHANMDLSNWDVRFRLGQVQEATEQAVNVKEVAVVYMSHAHAIAFAEALERVLERIRAMTGHPAEEPTGRPS